jgi:hypothetical protein
VGSIHAVLVCGKRRSAARAGWRAAEAWAGSGGGGSARGRCPHGVGVRKAAAGGSGGLEGGDSAGEQRSALCGPGDRQGMRFWIWQLTCYSQNGAVVS